MNAVSGATRKLAGRPQDPLTFTWSRPAKLQFATCLLPKSGIKSQIAECRPRIFQIYSICRPLFFYRICGRAFFKWSEMYVCMYVYMCVCMCVCRYIYIYMALVESLLTFPRLHINIDYKNKIVQVSCKRGLSLTTSNLSFTTSNKNERKKQFESFTNTKRYKLYLKIHWYLSLYRTQKRNLK